jgi:hypothetical protein
MFLNTVVTEFVIGIISEAIRDIGNSFLFHGKIVDAVAELYVVKTMSV